MYNKFKRKFQGESLKYFPQTLVVFLRKRTKKVSFVFLADWQNWMKSIKIEKNEIFDLYFIILSEHLHFLPFLSCFLYKNSSFYFFVFLSGIFFITTQVCPGFVIKRSHKRPEVNRVSLTFVLWWWWWCVCDCVCPFIFHRVHQHAALCSLLRPLFKFFFIIISFKFGRGIYKEMRLVCCCFISFFFDFI